MTRYRTKQAITVPWGPCYHDYGPAYETTIPKGWPVRRLHRHCFLAIPEGLGLSKFLFDQALAWGIGIDPIYLEETPP